MLNRILLFVFVATLSSHSLFSQWSIRHVYPECYTLNDIDVHSTSSHGIAVGEYGAYKIIAGSDTTGMDHFTWTSSRIQTDFNLYAAKMISADVIIVAGDKGTMFKSNDYGKTWKSVSVPTKEQIRSVDFLGLRRGIAVTNNGTVLTTQDGGDTWLANKQILDEKLERVRCVNDTTWIAVGECSSNYATLFLSRNGIDWVKYIDNNLMSPRLNDIVVAKPIGNTIPVIYVAGDHWAVLKSTDFGKTWEQMVISNLDAQQNSEYLSYGFSMGVNGQFGVFQSGDPEGWGYTVALFTTNGGVTWTNYRNGLMAAPADGMYNYQFYSDSGFVACGYFGEISEVKYEYVSYYSRYDYNYAYNMVASPIIHTIQKFDDDRFGIIASYSGRVSCAISEDKGLSWKRFFPIGDKLQWTITNIQSPDLKTIIVTADSTNTQQTSSNTWVTRAYAHIARSVDGGNTWELKRMDSTSTWFNQKTFFKMFDSNNGLLIPFGHYIYSTSDGGATWNKKPYSIQGAIYSNCVRVNSMKEYEVVIYDTTAKINRYIKTTDAGDTWTNLDYNTDAQTRGIVTKGIDGTLSVVSSYNDKPNSIANDSIWISRDNGTTWKLQYEHSYPITEKFYSPYFRHTVGISGKYGFYGTRGKGLFTIDSGKTWTADTNFLHLWSRYCGPVDMECSSPSTFLMASGDYIVFEYDASKIVSDVYEPPVQKDSRISLQTTNINDVLTGTSTVDISLILYSLDGKEVWNGKIDAGNTFQISTRSFPSGVYVLTATHNSSTSSTTINIVH
ncbi:MAG: T9SS type A sorting domain-containing protein [Candidatus Kapabacteria bacterium]|nr:T9SS type A sorting domain-containing protein [Candidatus Kapabacteria bacterium]